MGLLRPSLILNLDLATFYPVAVIGKPVYSVPAHTIDPPGYFYCPPLVVFVFPET